MVSTPFLPTRPIFKLSLNLPAIGGPAVQQTLGEQVVLLSDPPNQTMGNHTKEIQGLTQGLYTNTSSSSLTCVHSGHAFLTPLCLYLSLPYTPLRLYPVTFLTLPCAYSLSPSLHTPVSTPCHLPYTPLCLHLVSFLCVGLWKFSRKKGSGHTPERAWGRGLPPVLPRSGSLRLKVRKEGSISSH